MKNHLIDINNLVDVLVGINELLPKEQGGIDKVDGWLEGYTNENPYLGRGSLIYIKYTNEGLGNQVKYYAFNDTQVINLSFMFIKKLKSSEVLITDYLSVIAHKLLQTITNTTGWITDIVIKDDYKSKYGIPQSFTRFHTSHGFNMKNFISDLNTIIHNPSCVSKFVAAQCRIAMSEEARPKVEEARPRREGTGLRRYDSHGRRDGSRPNNRYGSRANNGNGSRPNRYGSSSCHDFQRSYNRDSRPARY